MIHIFDIDDTVIKNTSMWYFLKEALKDKVIKFSQVRRLPFDWLRYKLRFPDADFIENTVKHLQGIEKSSLEKIAELSFEKHIKNKIYADAVRLIRDLSRTERVIFATSSIDIAIKPLERFFGLEKSLATEMEFVNGLTTGRLTGISLFGEKKKDSVIAWLSQNGLSINDVCFYSDSYTDIPLLKASARPVAVNPDRTLTREAKKHSWKILRFRELFNENDYIATDSEK